MKIKQAFLILAFLTVAAIALLYVVSPQWFARSFLGMETLTVDGAHILRAISGLYLGLGLFWLFAASHSTLRNTAVLTTLIFAGGLVCGRILSLVADGLPSPIFIFYMLLELALIPVAYWVYRLPEE